MTKEDPADYHPTWYVVPRSARLAMKTAIARQGDQCAGCDKMLEAGETVKTGHDGRPILCGVLDALRRPR